MRASSPRSRSARELIERAEQALYEIAETGKYGQGFLPFANALSEAIDMAAAAYQRDGGLSGISCGLRDIDEKMGGLQPSDLIILAGRPAMGKTALATNVAYRVARNYKSTHNPDGSVRVTDGGVVAFFSLEMSAEQLATRIISEQAEIASERIRRGKIGEDEFHRLVEVSRDLQSLPLYIDATGGLTIGQLAARARRLKRQRGLGLVVVDYLQLLTGSFRRQQEGRVQEVSEITTGLKALAKELNVPILALSQLSRQVEIARRQAPAAGRSAQIGVDRAGRRCRALHLPRGILSGAPRPAPGTPEYLAWQDEMSRVHCVAEVIIGKQRHGPTGTVQLHFNPQFTKFDNLIQDDHLPQRFELRAVGGEYCSRDGVQDAVTQWGARN